MKFPAKPPKPPKVEMGKAAGFKLPKVGSGRGGQQALESVNKSVGKAMKGKK